MTDEPWTCGDDSCPWRGCTECPYKGGAVTDPPVNVALPWDNRGAAKAAAPAGNRGLTTRTVEES